MKFLPLDVCQYLRSLSCVSESGKKYQVCECAAEVHINPVIVSSDSTEDICHYGGSVEERTPAFSLEDLLRKENIGKIAWKLATAGPFVVYSGITLAIWEHPDTWPEEVKKLILP